MNKKIQAKKIIYTIILTIILFFSSSIVSDFIHVLNTQGLTGSGNKFGWPLTYKVDTVSPLGIVMKTNNLIIDIIFWLALSTLILYIPQIIAYFRKKQ